MSHTDTQFMYISGNDSNTLGMSSSYRTVGDRSGPISGSVGKMATPSRRSSSVASSRRRPVASRDAGMAAVRWSERWYSVQELAQEFNRKFPVLVRVAQEYCCSDGIRFKLNVKQVLTTN